MRTNKEYRLQALESLQGRWNTIVGATMIILIVSWIYTQVASRLSFVGGTFAILSGDAKSGAFSWAIYIVLFIVFTVIQQLFATGYSRIALDYARNEPSNIKTILSRFNIWPKIAQFSIIYSICSGLLMLLFVFPGVYYMYTYILVPTIFADNPELSVSEAMAESKRLMSGHRMNYFLLNLSFFGWMLLGALTCGFMFFFVNPYMMVAQSIYYDDLKKEQANMC